jgi:hypothetical protein
MLVKSRMEFKIVYSFRDLFSLFLSNKFGTESNFPSGDLALWLHEFSVVECPPDMKLGIQPH